MKSKKNPILSMDMPREAFKYIRQQPRGMGLRMRLTLVVSAELLVSALIAIGAAALIDWAFHVDSKILMMLVFVITSAVVGMLMTSLISRYFYEPFKKLVAAMERIADGDFDVRLTGRASNKEVAEIYAGFNMMAHELQAMETLQSDFVSNVSHEFKTPITAIEGYATLLQGTEGASEEQSQYIEKILFNTRRLSRLVGNILLLSKVDNKAIPTKPVTFRLDEQIRQSIVLLEAEWEKKNIEFDVDLDVMDYTGYENLLMHVWNNLIGNAVKFDPEGGYVGIRLKRDERHAVVTVEDNGPGISPEASKHVFNKFYQIDSSHKAEGNGLGLALVKQIVTLSDGSVSTENRAEGGCRFTVRRPLK